VPFLTFGPLPLGFLVPLSPEVPLSNAVGFRKGRHTVRSFLEMKKRGEKIAVLTVYDFLFAKILEKAGVDILLVGDTLGPVVLGYESTLPVKLEDMIRHAAAVRRGAPSSFIVFDLPFLTFQISAEEALRNAGRAVQETGAQGVKLEGGDERTCEVVSRLVSAGIPVVGHLGLTPQSVNALGGHRVQGREPEGAERLLRQARDLEAAGAFAVVLELVPAELAAEVTRALEIPTIGIGAGPQCDGQVLVLHDALGLNPDFQPRFLKRFAELHDAALGGVQQYVSEVRAGTYPDEDHSFARSE
jgi:3-methyl-2-oxobutanoate hydroxymethyltransferase